MPLIGSTRWKIRPKSTLRQAKLELVFTTLKYKNSSKILCFRGFCDLSANINNPENDSQSSILNNKQTISKADLKGQEKGRNTRGLGKKTLEKQ